MRLPIAVIVVALAIPVAAQDQKNDLTDMLAIALQQSSLTLPGSKPFHLKAEIIESTNPDSGYKGTFEEYWVSPEKWRWRIESPEFSQTKVVNGDKVLEQNTGDYFPCHRLASMVRRSFFAEVRDVAASFPRGRPYREVSFRRCRSLFLIISFKSAAGRISIVPQFNVTPGDWEMS
jgi:hypothetical protein